MNDELRDEFSLAREDLARTIAGEIVLSENAEGVLKKWRNIFKISQKELANELGITSSVVSDYESGRRSSPGIKVIKKYIDALLRLDTRNGGKVVRSFVKSTPSPPLSGSIVDIKEFTSAIRIVDFCKPLNVHFVTKEADISREVYGYTIIDSLRAITELSFSELIKLYGITTQRAMIFTKVSTGRTPMVAIKMTNLHPAVVILHGLTTVDEIAKRIAEAEKIPLAVCRLATVEDIVATLQHLE